MKPCLVIRFHGVRPLTRKKNSSQDSFRRLRVQLRYRKSGPKSPEYPRYGSEILTRFSFNKWPMIGHFETEKTEQPINVEVAKNFKGINRVRSQVFRWLSKGLNFSLKPKSIKHSEFLIPFELLFRGVKQEDFSLVKARLLGTALSSYESFSSDWSPSEKLTTSEFRAFI